MEELIHALRHEDDKIRHQAEENFEELIQNDPFLLLVFLFERLKKQPDDKHTSAVYFSVAIKKLSLEVAKQHTQVFPLFHEFLLYCFQDPEVLTNSWILKNYSDICSALVINFLCYTDHFQEIVQYLMNVATLSEPGPTQEPFYATEAIIIIKNIFSVELVDEESKIKFVGKLFAQVFSFKQYYPQIIPTVSLLKFCISEFPSELKQNLLIFAPAIVYFFNILPPEQISYYFQILEEIIEMCPVFFINDEINLQNNLIQIVLKMIEPQFLFSSDDSEEKSRYKMITKIPQWPVIQYCSLLFLQALLQETKEEPLPYAPFIDPIFHILTISLSEIPDELSNEEGIGQWNDDFLSGTISETAHDVLSIFFDKFIEDINLDEVFSFLNGLLHSDNWKYRFAGGYCLSLITQYSERLDTSIRFNLINQIISPFLIEVFSNRSSESVPACRCSFYLIFIELFKHFPSLNNINQPIISSLLQLLLNSIPLEKDSISFVVSLDALGSIFYLGKKILSLFLEPIVEFLFYYANPNNLILPLQHKILECLERIIFLFKDEAYPFIQQTFTYCINLLHSECIEARVSAIINIDSICQSIEYRNCEEVVTEAINAFFTLDFGPNSIISEENRSTLFKSFLNLGNAYGIEKIPNFSIFIEILFSTLQIPSEPEKMTAEEYSTHIQEYQNIYVKYSFKSLNIVFLYLKSHLCSVDQEILTLDQLLSNHTNIFHQRGSLFLEVLDKQNIIRFLDNDYSKTYAKLLQNVIQNYEILNLDLCNPKLQEIVSYILNSHAFHKTIVTYLNALIDSREKYQSAYNIHEISNNLYSKIFKSAAEFSEIFSSNINDENFMKFILKKMHYFGKSLIFLININPLILTPEKEEELIKVFPCSPIYNFSLKIWLYLAELNQSNWAKYGSSCLKLAIELINPQNLTNTFLMKIVFSTIRRILMNFRDQLPPEIIKKIIEQVYISGKDEIFEEIKRKKVGQYFLFTVIQILTLGEGPLFEFVGPSSTLFFEFINLILSSYPITYLNNSKKKLAYQFLSHILHEYDTVIKTTPALYTGILDLALDVMHFSIPQDVLEQLKAYVKNLLSSELTASNANRYLHEIFKRKEILKFKKFYELEI